MVDFNHGVELINKFHGSEVKTTLRLNDVVYMIKYPDPIRDKNNPLSYMNNQFSEHVGCRIFESCGIEAQATQIGWFKDIRGSNRIVVGCVDFTQYGDILYEFSKLSNQVQVYGKTGTSIEGVYDIIMGTRAITDKTAAIHKFWVMFVVDSLIGNTDRHFDNRGFIDKQGLGVLDFAPIYDCGSSLAALVSDEDMESLLNDESAFKSREYNLTSCYYLSKKRIFVHEIFKNPPKDLLDAFLELYPKIDFAKIYKIIEDVEYMSEIRKKYMLRAMELRYDLIFTKLYRLNAKQLN